MSVHNNVVHKLENKYNLVGKYIVMMKETQIESPKYLIKQLPYATAFVNSKFQVIYASDQWISDFNFTNIDVFGKTLHELFGGLNDTWITILQNCLKGQSIEGNREAYKDASGIDKHFECSVIPWYDDSENIIGIIIKTENIENNLSKELQLRKLKLLLDTKSEISRIGSWEYDILSQELFWCTMTKTLHEVPLNYEPDVETAVNFYKEGYSKNTISMCLFKAVENGISWSEKLQLITAKGKEICVITAGKPIYKAGKLVSIIGTFQDITDQVTKEVKIIENEQLLQTLIDNLPLNVYIKDKESRKILVNKAECNYLEVDSPNDLLGKSDFDLFEPTIAQISRDEDLIVLNTLKPILRKQTVNVKKDGTITSFQTSKIPLIGNDGIAYGIVGISVDITELKQKEEELRHLINVTSLQNKKLINFTHIVSHNLRSHAANFSMLLDFLASESDEEEKRKIIEMLTNTSNNLIETLDNLNDVVAISRNINQEKESINLKQRLNNVTKNLSSFLKNNKATIINEIPDDLCIKVIPSYIESILSNFITNAVKYKRNDEPPLIRLFVIRSEEYTILSIQDNGQGIDLKKYGDKLFGLYKTFHNSKDARGIGLYITKNQIEAMNGKISIESEVGKGTIFNIYFNERN